MVNGISVHRLLRNAEFGYRINKALRKFRSENVHREDRHQRCADDQHERRCSSDSL